MSSRFFLLILDGDRKGEEVPLEEGRFTIGRKEKNDLVLHDPRVSGFHAEVVREGEKWILRDLGSTNGTFLDGRRVEEVPLEHGDTFSVGVLRLRFVDREAGPLAEESQTVQVARVDRELLEKAGKKRSLTPLLLVFLLALGAGTWAYLYLGKHRKAGPKESLPQAVAGNLLPLEAASFEEGGEGAWDPKAGKGSFHFEPGGAHSGEMAAAADLEGGKPAVLDLRKPLAVKPGSGVRAGAFVRVTGGDGRAALHLVFHARESGLPLSALSTPWVVSGGKKGYRRLSLEARVPKGCSSVSLEIVAAGSSGRALVDDVFILSSEGGSSPEIPVPEYPSASILSGGAGFSVLQEGQPRILLLEPLLPPPGGEMTAADLLLAMKLWGAGTGAKEALAADFGGETGRFSVKVSPREEGLSILWKNTGPPGSRALLAWALAPDLQVTVIPARDGKGTRALRIKTRTDAVLLEWGKAPAARRLTGPGGIVLGWIPLPSGPVTLKVGFRKDWVLGKALLRKASQAVDGGRPGEAMALLRRLMEEVPYNEKDLEKARLLYGRLLQAAQQRLNELKTAAEKATLILAPGELKALARRAEEYRKEYQGEDSLCAEAEKIQKSLEEVLAGIVAKEREKERKRLENVLDSLGPEAGSLRKLVENYIRTRLGPEPPNK